MNIGNIIHLLKLPIFEFSVVKLPPVILFKIISNKIIIPIENKINENIRLG